MFWRLFWLMEQLRTFSWHMPYVFINMDQVKAKKQLRSVKLWQILSNSTVAHAEQQLRRMF